MIPPSPIGSKFEEPADTMPSVAAVVTAAPSIVMIVAMRSIAVTVRLLVVTLPVALTISTFAQRKILHTTYHKCILTVACAVQLAIRPEPLPKVTRARKFFISVVKPFTSDSTARR